MDTRWFDNYGLLHVDKQPSDSENGILFTAEYWTLKSKERKLNNYEIDYINKAIDSSKHAKGYYLLHPKSKEIRFSHDNMTGLICLMKLVGREDYKKFKFWFNDIRHHWKQRLHPRDIVFYAYCKGGFLGVLAYLFLFIPSLAMIISCLQDHKVRGGNKILKTDGKKLAWLRLNTLNLPLTKLICSFIINKNMPFKSWKNIFSMYFKNEQHPNNQFKKEIYDN